MADFEPQTTRHEGILQLQMPHFFDETYIVSAPDRWMLCSKSEGYLDESFAVGMVTVVNDALVVKPKGRLAGLCVRDVYDREGKLLFERGSWYCPVGFVRDELERNFGLVSFPKHSGQTRINIPGSSWCFMRKVTLVEGIKKEDFMQQVDANVANLPPFFVVQKVYVEQMYGNGGINSHRVTDIPLPYKDLITTIDELNNLSSYDAPISIDLTRLLSNEEFKYLIPLNNKEVIAFPQEINISSKKHIL